MPTVKKLSYCGVTIPLSSPDLEQWLRSVNPQDFRSWDGWNYDQPNTRSLPTPSLPTMPEFQVGVLTWPTGYSRPSSFHFVITSQRLALIKAAQGSTNSPQPLVMFDGRTGKTVTASMYMLPARPINLLGHTTSDAWLVTLTDQRFYGFWRRGSITTPVSWTDIYSQIGTILGITITPDTIDARYGTPSTKWALKYAPTPVLLDAVAAQIGQRVVVGLDGSVKTVNWTTARDASIAYINGSDTIVSGGTLDESDIARYVPSAVRVLSLDSSTSPPSATPHVETQTLAALAIAEYGAATGVSGFYQTINSDTPYTGSNLSAVQDYAEVAATDWYGWRLPETDLVYPGIEPWVPTGWEDAVEWTLQKRDPHPFASTRVRRGPWSDMISGDWYAGQGPSNPDPFNPCAPGLAPGCVPVPQSGSGSGSVGCDRVVETLDVSCGTGTRTLTSKFFDLQVVDGRVEIVECSTQDYDLGPCSPDNPGGTVLPVTTLVCPIFAAPRCVSSDITLDPDDRIVLADASGGGFTITLPPWREGDEFWVLKDYDGDTPVVVGDITLDQAGMWTHVVADCTGGWAYMVGGTLGSEGPPGPTGPQGDPGPNEVTAATATDLTGYLRGDGANVSAATTVPVSDLGAISENSVLGRSGTTSGTPAAITATLGSGSGVFTYDDDAQTLVWVQTLTANSFLVDNGGPTVSWLSGASARSAMGLGTVATLASDTDGTLAANSNSRIATQAAVVTFVNAQIATAISAVNETHQECVCTTVTALAAATYNNGSSGAGATLTGTVAAVLVLDGVTVALGDRVLIKNQADAKQNGIYTLTTVGTALIQWVFTRATDFDQNSDGIDGALVYVLSGATQSNTLWFCTTTGTVVFGTTLINWTQFTGSTYTADETSLHLTGTVFGIKSTWAGQTALVTLGTITTGTWQATIIGKAYGGTGEDNSTGGTANTFWARPNGGTGAAAYRAIIAADVPTLNQNTTGSAATLTTARGIYGNNFDGSAALTQIIASTYGGTGNGFFKVSGPATSEKTFTLPNATCTILTTNDLVTVAQGGTGAATLTSHGVLMGAGTSAVAAGAAGTSGQVFTSGGASADGSYQDPITATAGTGALGSAFVISGTTGTFQASGLIAALPAAGTYRVTFDVQCQVTGNVGTNWSVNVKMRNTSDSTDIANTTRTPIFTVTTGVTGIGCASVTVPITVAAAKNVELYAARNATGGGGSWTDARVSVATYSYEQTDF